MNRFIIADTQKCIGCRTCEVACVVSHQQDQDCSTVSARRFAPRIRVVKSDELSTATLCRQCEDAPCANVCPEGAIRHEGDVWRVDQRLCIGCKSCMVACPYGAMTVMLTDEGVQALKCAAGAKMRSLSRAPLRRTGLRGQLPDSGAALY